MAGLTRGVSSVEKNRADACIASSSGNSGGGGWWAAAGIGKERITIARSSTIWRARHREERGGVQNRPRRLKENGGVKSDCVKRGGGTKALRGT